MPPCSGRKPIKSHGPCPPAGIGCSSQVTLGGTTQQQLYEMQRAAQIPSWPAATGHTQASLRNTMDANGAGAVKRVHILFVDTPHPRWHCTGGTRGSHCREQPDGDQASITSRRGVWGPGSIQHRVPRIWQRCTRVFADDAWNPKACRQGAVGQCFHRVPLQGGTVGAGGHPCGLRGAA